MPEGGLVMDDEDQKQAVQRSSLGQISVAVDVGKSSDGFIAYAMTVGRTPRLETPVSGSRTKNTAISYALTELALMFDREAR
jgi:hypothetical protein